MHSVCKLIVRRPEDDLQLRSKHLALHVIKQLCSTYIVFYNPLVELLLKG